MNYNERNLSGSSKQWTTEEVMAHIKASQQQRASFSAGTDYFANHDVLVVNAQMPVDLIDEASATALNNKDGIKNFKAVAPMAHPTTASSGDDDITSGTKLLAAAANEPTNKAVVVPLRSPNDEHETKDTCGADDDADPVTTGNAYASTEDDALFDPNFYKVRVDFFDNGDVRNRTRFTAKLSVQVSEHDDPAQNMELFANFYSRSRDFKAFIEKNECWDAWYDRVWEIFHETRDLELDFRIKPKIAIFKERSVTNGKTNLDPLMHTACILYEAHNAPPVVMMLYQLWAEELSLDASFQAKSKSAPYKIGYFIDPARKHLDSAKQSRGLKVKTRRDFGQ